MRKFTYKKHLTSNAEKALLVLARKKKIKEEEILPVLKKFHLTDALNTIAKYYQKILQVTDIDEFRIFNCSLPNTENYVTSSSLAKLAHLFIISGANDFRHLKLSDKAIPNILFLSNIILSHFENDIPLDQNSLLNHLLIMYTEQIELQKNIKHSLCRNYKFYFEKYGELFEEKVGITINEYYKTCLLILLF